MKRMVHIGTIGDGTIEDGTIGVGTIGDAHIRTFTFAIFPALPN